MRAELSRLARLVAVLCTFVLASVAPSAALAGEGGVGYRVDGEPGSALEGGFITLHVGVGGTATGHFIATNSGSRDAQLKVYAADGLTGDTTGIVYSDAGIAVHDAGGWLSPSTGGMLLPADGERRIDFSLRVPGGTRPGDHVGGLVLEQRRTGSSISQVVRNVVPVLIDVTGNAGLSLALRSAMVSDLPGTDLPAVTVKMVNNGGRICRPTLSVSLVGPSERGNAVVRQLDAILPGDSVPYPLPWPRKLDRGTYTASVTATGCGQSASLHTDVRSDVTAESDPPKSSTTDPSPVVTKAAPGPVQYTAPHPAGRDSSGSHSKRDQSKTDRPAAAAGGTPTGGTPTGAAGSGRGSTKDGPGSSSGAGATIHDLGQVAIKYLPPLLERLIAPLSLVGLMLLFLFAQEAFDRKDAKLALAPIHRDPDLEFSPLDDSEFLTGSGGSPDLEVVRSPSGPHPLTP